MIRVAIGVGVLVFGACACPAPTPEFPTALGQSRSFEFPGAGLGQVRLVTAVQRSGSPEAVLAYLRDGKLWIQSADGGSSQLIGAENFPFELAIAVRDASSQPDFAVNRWRQPYAELTWSAGGSTTIVTSTGSVSLSPKLGWLEDGAPYLLSDQQGLTACADRPVIMRCLAGACSSRCLSTSNAGTVSSVLGGVVLSVNGAGISLFNVSSETFDGGTRGLSADSVFKLDAGNPDQLALSLDGQHAVALSGFPKFRLFFFSPADASTINEVSSVDECEPRALLSGLNHAFLVCRYRSGDALALRLLAFGWHGALEQTVELGEDRDARYVAPHRDQVLVGTGFDGGIDVKRVF